MIHVLEMPCDAPPRAWFAFDTDDLARKLEASDVAELHAAGRCRVFADESAALAAFERADDPDWQGEVPLTVLITPEGKVAFRATGAVDPLELRRAVLRELDARKPW